MILKHNNLTLKELIEYNKHLEQKKLRMEDKKFKILIVDDNPQNLQVLGNLLEKNNYIVESAQSGRDALEWVKSYAFDLILLDVMMPEMDGFEVCEIIRKNVDYNDVPIIFLTAKTDKLSTIKGFELNAQDYISKPFDSAELTSRIRTQLELKDSKDKLKDVNKWLEQKVDEKTHELKESNIKLTETLLELQKLDKMKTYFLHLTSNEIRTPLTGIVGTLHLIKNQEAASTLKDLIELLEKSVSRLENFAKKAILTTELSSKSYNLNIKPVNITELIQFCILEQTDIIVSKQIQINENYETESIVNCDKDLVFKMFSYIIGNAISHTIKNKIDIRITKQNNSIHCSFTDYGTGFNEETLNSLYSPYNINDKDFQKVSEMSMYILKLIMENLNGDVSIYNKENEGGCVELIFNS